MEPEIGTLEGNYLDLILPGNGARNSFWCLLELRRYFPKEEGKMQHNNSRYSFSDETKVVELVGEPRNTT